MKLRRGMLLLPILAGLLALTACSAPTTAAPGTPTQQDRIPGKWVEATVSADQVTLPFSLVEQNVNTHFKLEADGRELAFMAYLLQGTLHVRANACPPCRSRGFTLVGDVLDCDACHTTFRARDGNGIAGACVDYPKAAVNTAIVDGSIMMAVADLVDAYDETLVAG